MKIHRRGIILISILILTLVATFFLGALIQMNPGRLRQTVHDEKRDMAAMAARAGVDYALNRFKSDIDWKADANTEVVNTKDLVIREDRGNVLGWIKTDQGQWTGFRIRFNFQDGSSGGDAMDDPAYPISSAEISLNNLAHSERPLYRGTGSNYQPGTDPDDLVMTVPENTVAILSEGVVSSRLDPSDPAGLAQMTAGTTRAVEGIYAISSVSEGVSSDSVLSSMEVDIRVADKLSLKSNSDNVARIRSKSGVELHSNSGASGTEVLFDPDEDAEVLTHTTNPFSALTASDPFQGGVENPDNAFLKINSDSVATSDQANPIEIPGGVYIFTEGDKDSGRTLEDNVKYFDMTWEEYREAKINGPQPIPADSLPPGFADLDIQLDIDRPGVEGKRDVITIDKDVNIVDSASGKRDISIIPERGARQKAGEDPVEEELPVLVPGEDPVAESYLSVNSGVIKTIAGASDDNKMFTLGQVLGEDGEGDGGVSVVNIGTFDVFNSNSGSDAMINLYNDIREGRSFEAMVPLSEHTTTRDAIYAAFPGVVIDIDDISKIWTITPGIQGPAMLGFSGGGGGGSVDPLHIPKDPSAPPGTNDETVPQDIEIAFAPVGGDDSGDSAKALIRSQGDVFLGTHLSGSGGGVIAKGDVNLIGFGVDLQALSNQGKASLAIFSGESAGQGINISTYDERRNKYWDVDVDGAIFSEKNIFIRLGEDDLASGETPKWGSFEYAGAIIALGDANSLDAHWEPPPSGGNGHWAQIDASGTTKMMANSISLFFDPRFLAPYLEEEKLSPTFAAVSVVER